MDWFERITGFPEDDYASTKARLEVDGQFLISKVNGNRHRVGQLEVVTLQNLRARRARSKTKGCNTSVHCLAGDARELHARPEFAGATFQVASQFNLLEMVGPNITPEHGVTRYAGDPTQGPACAIAAGAATIYRNYFAKVADQVGQTRARQLDGFAEFGQAIAQALGKKPGQLWTMRNGYALFNASAAVDQVSDYIQDLDEAGRAALRQMLRIGLHWDVEVTDAPTSPGPLVSQAFCSALPVAYNHFERDQAPQWAPLASLVLEAAYEATLWAAVIQAQQGGSNKVLLTSLGGGVFGNDERWIRAAISRAVAAVRGHGLEVVLVSFRPPTAEWLTWAKALAGHSHA